MDPYALKSPNELLRMFTLIDNNDRVGAKYILKYIEEILENKGYDIVIEDNTYRLEPHIPVKREKMYEMPVEDLLALHIKLVNKTSTQHIPDKLRKTLIRRTKDILINRGAMINFNKIGTPVIFDNLKEAMVYAQTTGNNDWVVVECVAEMSTKSVGKQVHEAIFDNAPVDSLSYTAREIVNKIKENVKSNKENNMKTILIKFENNLLVNYVATKLRNELILVQVEPKINISDGKYTALLIRSRRNGNGNISQFNYNSVAIENAKLFVVTNGANADTIIEEVVKEYNKVETVSFTIGGAYNGHTIPVIVYPDQVSFNNEYMTFQEFIALRNSLIGQIGGFQIGGVGVVLFTHSRTETKVYVQRDEFKPIIDAILARLSA